MISSQSLLRTDTAQITFSEEYCLLTLYDHNNKLFVHKLILELQPGGLSTHPPLIYLVNNFHKLEIEMKSSISNLNGTWLKSLIMRTIKIHKAGWKTTVIFDDDDCKEHEALTWVRGHNLARVDWLISFSRASTAHLTVWSVHFSGEISPGELKHNKTFNDRTPDCLEVWPQMTNVSMTTPSHCVTIEVYSSI